MFPSELEIATMMARNVTSRDDEFLDEWDLELPRALERDAAAQGLQLVGEEAHAGARRCSSCMPLLSIILGDPDTTCSPRAVRAGSH